MAGWVGFRDERDQLLKKYPAFGDDLKGVCEIADRYQIGRALEAANALAGQYQSRLARWPLANVTERIREDEFGPLVSAAKAALADPGVLGDSNVAAGTVNLRRMVGTADFLETRKKVAIQIKLGKQDDPSFRSLILGEDYLNLNDVRSVTRLVPLDRFEYKARYSDKPEVSGGLRSRWSLLERFWDPETGVLRTNGVASLPLEGGSTVNVQIVGASWAE